jgi:hypothetical protein
MRRECRQEMRGVGAHLLERREKGRGRGRRRRGGMRRTALIVAIATGDAMEA